MSEPIRPEFGALPWQPSEGVEMVEILDEYDRPLAGVLDEGGHRHLFACIAGRTDRWNLWAFTSLENELEEPLRAGEAGAVEATMQRAFAGGPCIVALASADDGVQDIAYAAHADELPGVVQTLLDRAPMAVRAGAVTHWVRILEGTGSVRPLEETSRVVAWDAGQETWFARFVGRAPSFSVKGVGVEAAGSIAT